MGGILKPFFFITGKSLNGLAKTSETSPFLKIIKFDVENFVKDMPSR